MAFGDLKSDKGVAALDDFLKDHSYISGYQPTQADIQTFQSLGKAPNAKYSHALRWYNHINSFAPAERTSFPGGACPMKTAAPTTAPGKAEDDDDVDLFASDDENDAEAEKIREERLKAYADKKSKKPALIAKSSIVLDVKPWDDETDMKEMEKRVRTIEMDGLVWGASKLVPVGYGIHKLQIMSVVEDDKVSVDLMVEEIEKFEDFVQSVDIAAFNKI
ncbi:hypothetical protein PPYR_12993 [Photinus pyralis]|uniref:Translation elongation factor EF1B beta/delta subunit guanine nucleotide exchange domain-containing protein n=1 Tax=Photinus pyralis TaxID=7054 RepID=A0A5N4A7S9_PHOPY|nr:elongation factor 1-beta'-like [Photinus pyralis]KAB0793373.1 hypothetical protein PPYR_12993 [Photinus pyralis]